MNRKLSIGLDLDGVVADMRQETKIRFCQDIGHEEWEVAEKYFHTSDCPLTPDGWMREQFEDTTFWRNAIPFEDSWLMCNKWFQEGHDVFIVTARYPTEIPVSQRWIDEWDIFVNDLLSYPMYEKYKAVQKYGLDLFVEDNPHEAALVDEHTTSFIINRPYNQFDISTGPIRVDSMYEIDEFISGTI